MTEHIIFIGIRSVEHIEREKKTQIPWERNRHSGTKWEVDSSKRTPTSSDGNDGDGDGDGDGNNEVFVGKENMYVWWRRVWDVFGIFFPFYLNLTIILMFFRWFCFFFILLIKIEHQSLLFTV